MAAAYCTLDLRLPENGSLKGKRQVIRSVTERSKSAASRSSSARRWDRGRVSAGSGSPARALLPAGAGVDVADVFRKGREKIIQGDVTGGEELLEKGLKAFNWRVLYNELSKLKAKFPDETVMNVAADPDVPFAAIVRLMDVSRYRLEKESYDGDKQFWDAKYKKVKVKDEKDGTLKEKPADLFSDPVLSIAQ